MKTIKTALIFAILSNRLSAQETSGSISCMRPKDPKSSFNSCQLLNTWHDKDGNPIYVTQQNKFNTPLGTRYGARRYNLSYLRTLNHIKHPSPAELFPAHGSFSGQLNSFLESVKKDNYFITYFSKIHLLILHELYAYLTKIYTTFNMSKVDNISDYLANEYTQALNRKTLIINHFVALIEAQSNQAFLARFPTLPQTLATHAGFTMMKHDYGADLNLMLENAELDLFNDAALRDHVKTMRSSYLDTFGKYLLFFKNYTASINQPDKIYGSQLVAHMKAIKKIIDAQSLTIPSNAPIKTKAQALQSMQTINPPIFLYDDETIRIVKLIPKLARALPPNTQSIAWPARAVLDAEKGTYIQDKFQNYTSTQPQAYFLDAQGNRTQSSAQAKRLFVNIPTMNDLYSQELLPQPAWLNSADGIITMLKVCLGDFSSLFNPIFRNEAILDPCLACIVLKASLLANIPVDRAQEERVCKDCQSYLDLLKKEIQAISQPSIPEEPTSDGDQT